MHVRFIIRRDTDLLELVGAPAGGRAFVRAPPPLICPGPGGLKHTNTHCFRKDVHAKEQLNKEARARKSRTRAKHPQFVPSLSHDVVFEVSKLLEL